jgi:hypothetical protein
MSNDLVEIAKSAQEQVLAGIAALQETTLEGFRALATSVASAVPAGVPTVSIPGADALPDAATTVDLTFGFVEKLVAGQRRFVEDLVNASAAQTSPATSAATAAAPKK